LPLFSHKKTINRYFQISGLDASIDSGVEFDALFHASGTQMEQEFKKIRAEQGLKAALTWRDSKFGDGRTLKKK
jgi:enoyl-CoA hydratase